VHANARAFIDTRCIRFFEDLGVSLQIWSRAFSWGAYLLATLSPTEKVLRFIGMIGMNALLRLGRIRFVRGSSAAVASFEAISEKVPLAT